MKIMKAEWIEPKSNGRFGLKCHRKRRLICRNDSNAIKKAVVVKKTSAFVCQ